MRNLANKLITKVLAGALVISSGAASVFGRVHTEHIVINYRDMSTDLQILLDVIGQVSRMV